MSAALDFVIGDATGLAIPAHPAALEAAGADFLTAALHAFGALPPGNSVSRIVALRPCPGGSTGRKLFATIAYAQVDPALHTELFIKFSRDFDDARRDWQRTEMASEARFEALAAAPNFPIAVPKPYFADYHGDSGTGIVITERLFFGENGIEPLRRKCLDHLTLERPLDHYRVMIATLARLAAAHRSGRLAPDIEDRFPFDPIAASADPIRDDEATFHRRLGDYAAFAARSPQLLPAEIAEPDFIAAFAETTARVRRHEAALQAYLTGDADLIALCHWNAHIDNAFFWREASGLRCGLIDWGRVGQITFGSALWGCLSAAHHDIWDRHLDELLTLFVTEYRAHGGPAITVAQLDRHLSLHIATMAVARMLVFPEMILFRLPEAVDAAGPRDSMFETSDPARNALHIFTVMLKHWRRRDFGAMLDDLLEDASTNRA